MARFFVGAAAFDQLGGLHAQWMAAAAENLQDALGGDGVSKRFVGVHHGKSRFGLRRKLGLGKGGDSWNSVLGLNV